MAPKATNLIGLVLAATCLLSAAFAPAAVASFGFQSVEFSATEKPTEAQEARHELGVPDTRAGSHPWALTTKFAMNTTVGESGQVTTDGDLKDIFVELPPGLVGNATVVPQCGIQQFETKVPFPHGESNYLNNGADSCPADTQVGYSDVRLIHRGVLGDMFVDAYNLVPPTGSPAQFGFNPVKIPVILRPTVRSGGDYGLTVAARDITQFERVGADTVTFWGVPGEAGHDALRGECLGAEGFNEEDIAQTTEGMTGGECPYGSTPQPFLTMPTSCTEAPLGVRFVADSWQDPGSFNADGTPDLSDSAWVQKTAFVPPMKGCAKPAFGPTLTAAPDTTTADSPAGLTAEVNVGQDGLLSAVGIAPADIEDTTVALPVGVAVNPGQAAGLAACRQGDGGQSGEDDVGSELPALCPSASKVGTDEIQSPLLRDPLKGGVYVLQSNPPELELLVVAAADGVEVKLPAKVHLDAATGQLTTTLADTPELPFTHFALSFSGGAQAALVTPATCGTYTTSSDFLPYSSPFAPDLPATNSFQISTGPNGSGAAGCTGPLPFGPAMTAGGTTDRAGAFTSFSFLLTRGDGQQRIQSLQFKTPPGLLADIGNVPLCDEADANAGTCPAASEIGHTVVQAGPGPYPLLVPEPGRPEAPIYLTGAYGGAPYGLSIAVPVLTGPFDLGTQVVRAAIAVDQFTAQLTITTDSSGPYAIPTILRGIPTDLRTIDAVIDRPSFMFNPTSCAPQAFTGTAVSDQGARAALSSHFQVGSCGSLAFKPTFTASTQGRTSKKNGASLTVKLVQAAGDANIHSVKVDLPKQLPSRLTTLQKACLAKVFEANPASCPAASVVGTAKAITPVLPGAGGNVSGPVYFVSHGGEAFPSLIVVLQGYGVTVQLVGTTFISKAGITSSTFKTIPDVPVSTFELSIPEGPYSALGANLPSSAKYSLCGQKLTMPTAIEGQNGGRVNASTKIAVTGCPKVKQAVEKKAKAKRAGRDRRATR